MKHLENKTKIIVTIGPSCSSREQLERLLMAGARVFRLNFSHGTHEEHHAAIKHIRALNKKLHTQACLLQDLQGPKIRLGNIKDGQLRLERGKKFVITTKEIIGHLHCVSTSYQHLSRDAAIGQTILINDGNIELKIKAIADNDIHTEVVHGGVVKSKQGLNLPDTATSLDALTEKDQEDLDFGLRQEVEWVALSFVRQAADVLRLKEKIQQAGKRTKVVAKIEKSEALEHLEEIIEVSDALMVARGDLGVEIPMEQVPVAQKRIVKLCNEAAKPVIIATHMMESMIESSRPTRAETNDVANAVIDGADAVMLSAETATGKYPVEAVKSMYKAIITVEKHLPFIYEKNYEPQHQSPRFISDYLIQSACALRKRIEARAIVAMTQSGYSGFRASSFRPCSPILVFSNCMHTVHALSLAWGVQAFHYDMHSSTDETIRDIERFLKDRGIVKLHDFFIILASMPIDEKTITNTLKVNVVSAS